MEVIVPNIITLTASNIPASATELYVSGTTYTKGTYVLVTDSDRPRIYCSLVDGNVGNYPPENLKDTKDDENNDIPAPWKDTGPTNRWAMFDTYISTSTVGGDTVEVSVYAGRCDSVALFGLEAVSAAVEITNNATSEVVYSETVDLRLDASSSWSDYFFGDFLWKNSAIVRFPIYYNATAKITITHNPETNAVCGQCIVGRSQYLGESKWGITSGIEDYSQKNINDSGTVELIPGKFAKTMSVPLQMATSGVDNVQKIFAALRATPCVWRANNDGFEQYESAVVFGSYKDFSTVFPGPTKSICNLEIEGLI